MADWLKRIFTESTLVGIILASAIIGLIGGLASGAAQFRRNGLGGMVRAAIIGVFVAIIVGLGVADYVNSEAAKLAIVGACAAIGESILAGLHALGTGLRTDPLGTLSRIIDALRGHPPGDKS